MNINAVLTETGAEALTERVGSYEIVSCSSVAGLVSFSPGLVVRMVHTKYFEGQIAGTLVTNLHRRLILYQNRVETLSPSKYGRKRSRFEKDDCVGWGKTVFFF